ncbi:tail fiber domain-containing protein [Oscillospiraceae bacterium N12]|jgi:hypothetical protein|uniref:Tail fiber domain-containing protein n=1 Tax=Jilunia laotingensis TaxID=2763675 RepID=A0A926IJF3_9BACT|nr:tail fiber domain-containing protein [Jilunia laotingensis]MBC8592767.1 tail fiber domain-containing protein [Jilunia laotingensis]
MKVKLLLFFSAVLFCLQINAQLKVVSTGKVGVKTYNPQYGSLQIGKSGVNNGIAIYDSLSSLPPLRFYTSGNYGFLNFGNSRRGITIRNDGRLGVGATLSTSESSIDALINLYIYRSNPCTGLKITADPGYDYGDVIKVYSKRHTDMAYVVRDLSTGSDLITFYVNGDGSIFSKGTFLTSSDENLKSDIAEISGGLDKIKKMQGVTYKMKYQEQDVEVQSNDLQTDSLDTTSSIQSPVSVEIANQIKAEKQRKKAGFIAQELEKVFPEAVYTTIEGTKAIAYGEIIPLLVEAIKEQQSEIDELKQVLNAKNKTRAADNGENESEDDSLDLDERGIAALYSNIPNPFKEETKISFFIPEKASQASLHIYNLQGKQVKQINISERGSNSVIIKGYELNPGMYMYTLIVDGKDIDTKKMILTE